MSESSTRISKVYAPNDSEHQSYKREIENGLLIRIGIGSPVWISSVIPITPYSAKGDKVETFKVLYIHT